MSAWLASLDPSSGLALSEDRMSSASVCVLEGKKKEHLNHATSFSQEQSGVPDHFSFFSTMHLDLRR